MNEVDDDRLVAAYLKIRDQAAVHKKEFEEAHKRFTDARDKILEEMLNRMNMRGNDGFKTEHGTVYRFETVRCSVADEALLYGWIKENDAMDMLERRIKSTAVQEYIAEKGETPPGVNVFREYTARVRATK